jgi:sulfoxide reductase heme-binding subunit YedZ
VTADHVTWVLARGSGFAAIVALTAAMATGLVIALRIASPRWPAAITTALHRTVTSIALWLTGAHLLLLLTDSQSGFGVGELLVPFAADERRVATLLGIAALYAMLAVVISTWLRSRIGAARWRRLHRLAFVAYAAAIAHGILQGTDTGTPWATFTYLSSLSLIGGLVVVRAMTAGGRARRPHPPAEEAAPRTPPPRNPLPPLPGRPLPPGSR